MTPLANKERELYVNQKTAMFSKKNLKVLMLTIILGLGITIIIQVDIEELQIAFANLRYKIPGEISAVSCNG